MWLFPRRGQTYSKMGTLSQPFIKEAAWKASTTFAWSGPVRSDLLTNAQIRTFRADFSGIRQFLGRLGHNVRIRQ